MISIKSKKDISVNLSLFESGKVNKLIIVGESGAGKSMAAKYFSKKYNIPTKSTDDFFWENRDLKKDNPNEFRRLRKKYEDGLIESKERCIIEGAGIFRMNPESVRKQSIILLGKSGLRGAIDAGIRNRAKGVATGKFFPEFWVAFKVNWQRLSVQVSQLRKELVADKSNEIKNVNIPFIQKRV